MTQRKSTQPRQVYGGGNLASLLLFRSAARWISGVDWAQQEFSHKWLGQPGTDFGAGRLFDVPPMHRHKFLFQLALSYRPHAAGKEAA